MHIRIKKINGYEWFVNNKRNTLFVLLISPSIYFFSDASFIWLSEDHSNLRDIVPLVYGDAVGVIISPKIISI